ncbi:MAG: saccharopine dehydrogenase NADP-binding domain-containing protein, partial [Nocardiaceae bacterium]|nr:saccharopine dehydrogenase NADP-binding domain-containing protein [Nocardiaceae bacterium]
MAEVFGRTTVTAREFDLVLFGATGFVGGLTADYIARSAPAGARIALAGRSADKLAAVRDALPGAGREWQVIVVDASAPEELAKRAKVVVTTVGPYAKYGLPLVKACAEAGTHYADLTGEPQFIKECIDKYHDVAVNSGAKIVNACGYDSVPSDLNVYEIYRKSLADQTGELESATLVASIKGGLSGGTVASMRELMADMADDP